MTITSSSLWEWRKVQSLFLFPQRIGITNPACGALNYSHKEMQICPISKKLDKSKVHQVWLAALSPSQGFMGKDKEPGYSCHTTQLSVISSVVMVQGQ